MDERDPEPPIELALGRCRRVEDLASETTRLRSIQFIRSAFRRATECLAANHDCSLQEAQRWIQQEAMARRVTLAQVAWEIIARCRDLL